MIEDYKKMDNEQIANLIEELFSAVLDYSYSYDDTLQIGKEFCNIAKKYDVDLEHTTLCEYFQNEEDEEPEELEFDEENYEQYTENNEEDD